MTAYSVPVYASKYDGSGFSKVNCPVWRHEFVGNNEQDTLHASFFAHPNQAETTVYIDGYDGEEYHPLAAINMRTGLLISANDTGYNSVLTLVRVTMKVCGVNFWYL